MSFSQPLSKAVILSFTLLGRGGGEHAQRGELDRPKVTLGVVSKETERVSHQVNGQ